jgi:hypothetical protein
MQCTFSNVRDYQIFNHVQYRIVPETPMWLISTLHDASISCQTNVCVMETKKTLADTRGCESEKDAPCRFLQTKFSQKSLLTVKLCFWELSFDTALSLHSWHSLWCFCWGQKLEHFAEDTKHQKSNFLNRIPRPWRSSGTKHSLISSPDELTLLSFADSPGMHLRPQSITKDKGWTIDLCLRVRWTAFPA